MKQLSIVMPALTGRYGDCVIVKQIHAQIEALKESGEVEFFVLLDNGPLSTGTKLRHLYTLCSGRYICGAGDDDTVEDDYVASLLEAVKEHDVDVVTFDHTYNVNGEFLALTHQLPHGPDRQIPRDPGMNYEVHTRRVGPLCPVRAEIVKAFEPPDLSDREDTAYKDYLGTVVKTHHEIGRVLYHHMWQGKNKEERQKLREVWRRG